MRQWGTEIHPEWATTRLWECIFDHIIFADDKWVVSAQQPPTHQPGELRRVDLVVEKMDSTVAFIDCFKHASALQQHRDSISLPAA